MFTVSQAAIERVIRDMQTGATDEYEKQYFADDPEMLAFVTEQQQNRANARANNSQAEETEVQA